MSKLRSLALCVTLLAAVIGFNAVLAGHPAHAEDKAPLFVNVTSEDPWKVSMAAFFATNFALKQGHKATVFVNVQATPLFTKGKSGVRSEQFGKTVHEMYREFLAAGGKVLICPVCMKASGIAAGDLIEGAEIATIATVNDVLFRPDTKTLAW